MGYVKSISNFIERVLYDRQLPPQRLLRASGLLRLYRWCRAFASKCSAISRVIHGKDRSKIETLLKKVELSADKKSALEILDEIRALLDAGGKDASTCKYINVSRALRCDGRLQEAEAYLRHASEILPLNKERKADKKLRAISVERGSVSLARRMSDMNGYVQSILDYRIQRGVGIGARKIAVVSAVTGGYDAALLPEFVERGIDYIVFSDQKFPDLDVIDVRPLPWVDVDKTRSARYVKTHLTRLLPEHDVIMWMDGNIMPVRPLLPIIHDFVLSGFDFFALMHPYRVSPYEEMRECIVAGKGNASLIQRQREHYRSLGYDSNQLIESNIFIVNSRSKRITEFFDSWWEQISRFSRRDQLSLNYCLDKTGIRWAGMSPRGVSARNHPAFVIFGHGDVPEGYAKFIAEVSERTGNRFTATSLV